MDEQTDSAAEQNVNTDEREIESADGGGITLEAYARHLDLPVGDLQRHGLATIANPWDADHTAVGIPYRHRDGAPFRSRIRQSLSGAESKRARTLWDRREEK